MDQNCTEGYAGNGCIGTAVHTHTGSGTLPITGLPIEWIVLVAVLLVGAGALIVRGRR